jgi:hypothetical protein
MTNFDTKKKSALQKKSRLCEQKCSFALGVALHREEYTNEHKTITELPESSFHTK